MIIQILGGLLRIYKAQNIFHKMYELKALY